jgi:hypothetical protein
LDALAFIAAALAADAVLPRRILTRSSWYCAVTLPVSSRTSKNSVSPSRRLIVSQLTGFGEQWPSPWALTRLSTRNSADFLSLLTPR